MILRAEVGNLRGHVAPKRRRVEARERVHGGGAGLEARPQAVHGGPNWGYSTDSCDHDPTQISHAIPFFSAARLIPASVRDAMP